VSETVQTIATAISTVGFPIACCCFLLWQSNKQDEYNRKAQEELRKTIDNNTKSIDKLGSIVRELARMIKGDDQ
jgi:hypothetical protein